MQTHHSVSRFRKSIPSIEPGDTSDTPWPKRISLKSKRTARTQGFALSHVGAVRKRNEDATYVSRDGHFAVLSDGMGGHRGGQEASKMAVSMMKNDLKSWFSHPEDNLPTLAPFLKEKFAEISREIHETGQSNPELLHMGATLVTWMHLGEEVCIAHVGDSRAYLLQNGLIYQMTTDHTMEVEHLKAGHKRHEVKDLRLSHMLSRNVGAVPSHEPDILTVPCAVGDLWLLCSDGLSNKLTHLEIAQYLVQEDWSLSKKARRLVEAAYQLGGEDNITVCLMEIMPPG